MSAWQLQAAQIVALQSHPTPINQSLAPQHLFCGRRFIVQSDSIPSGPHHPELRNVSWNGTNVADSHARIARQNFLWRQFFLNPSMWVDNRWRKKNPQSPDFRHRETMEVLWLDNLWKPSWVDEQLKDLDSQQPGPPWSSYLGISNSPGLTNGAAYESYANAEGVSRLCADGLLAEAIEALGVLVEKQCRVPTSLLYLVIRSCVVHKDLALGRRVHELASRSGYDSNTFVATHILRMYSSHGRLREAKGVFARVAKPDAFSWSALIAAHSKHGEAKQAVELYKAMRCSSVKPDGHVFVAALQACALAADLETGKQVHGDLAGSGLEPHLFVWTCLVDMYVKCGRLEDARSIFDMLVVKDVVTWNAMLAGYADHERGQEALCLYEQMELEGLVLANIATFACLLKACANTGALEQGKQVHSQIVERGLECDTVLGACLVDMYAKCGRLQEAHRVFDSLATRDVVAWTIMINGFGQSNEAARAFECFHEMTRDGIQANETTFTCLLVACSHEGLVKEGWQLFKVMSEDFGIVPTDEHYTCMVDLLGRAGYLDEAERMLLSFESDDVGFRSLLNACKSHGDLERGLRCFENLLKLDSQDAASYVLMGNMYAHAGRWSDVERVERLRKAARASKKAAVAVIEVMRFVHTFVVGEARPDIASKVCNINVRLQAEGGHRPCTELVLKPLSETQREDELCGHAEKLALAYGLLNTPEGTPLLVTKNLRMCGDCHTSTEILSRIENREIVVRDGHRVHRFVDGSCHCGGRP